MIRLNVRFELDYLVNSGQASFIFNVQPAFTLAQTVLHEQLVVTDGAIWHERAVPGSTNRLISVKAAAGTLHMSYQAEVTLLPVIEGTEHLAEAEVSSLPDSVLPFLTPSRYCESDRLLNFAEASFGQLPSGYARVLAIRDWVRSNVKYSSLVSSTRTSAVETLTERVGVCRDFAHVMIALCRAMSIPARYVTGTDFGADPGKPPDFHAYVEVWLGQRWYIFDPSGMGIPMGYLRIGTGRDAADVPFAMMFGDVTSEFAPLVRATPVEGPGLMLPHHVDGALSTA
ncbi:Transglutaminase-like superfamily protein [Roseateles sp. YR242]|uniref:transglutaminase-like domain-containing protein n=1 Tax=Roseateles sp. YR242 TaxID=1855305 RepID=UPI0008B93456|nr:transglutaminase-like domain-containing protein [Roseateles sp. YR242]SEK66371.1 Transglutaminase-like superfamily protein [Roseateles sp. YR242]